MTPPFSNTQRRELLKYLLAADQTRAPASERALQLPLYEQFALMGELSAFSFNPFRSGPDGPSTIGAIFSGNDPFSLRYRERQRLFEDISTRILTGMPGSEQREIGETARPVVRSLEIVQTEIQSYAQSQGYSEEWINQITLYSIMRIRSTILGTWIHGIDYSTAIREMLPFLEQSRAWLASHPEFNDTREGEYIQRLINRSRERR